MQELGGCFELKDEKLDVLTVIGRGEKKNSNDKSGRLKDMFCTQCGTKLPDGSKFCNECGARLREVVKPASRTGNEEHKTAQVSEPSSTPIINARAELVYNFGRKPEIREPEKEVFLSVYRFSDAAYLATARGHGWRKYYMGEEDYPPEKFEEDTSEKQLYKLAEKWDKGSEKSGTLTSYIVSKEGAIGMILDEPSTDPFYDGDIEWLVYTKERMIRDLPKWTKDIVLQSPGAN